MILGLVHGRADAVVPGTVCEGKQGLDMEFGTGIGM